MRIENREFFEQLGKLFYALAKDRSIDPIEISELKMLISKDWMSQPQDSDLPIPQDVHFMFVEMDTLQALETSSTEAYTSFAQFYTLYPEVFTSELVDRILETATAINTLFPGHHSYRKNHLSDLSILLKEKAGMTKGR